MILFLWSNKYITKYNEDLYIFVCYTKARCNVEVGVFFLDFEKLRITMEGTIISWVIVNLLNGGWVLFLTDT